MKLSPLDIRKHEFDRKVRGYDPDEVRAFTDMVSRQWEEVLDDLRRAEDRARELEGKIAHYEKVEEALHEALETSRSGAKKTQEHAEERARLTVEEAELRAKQIIHEAEQEHSRLRQGIVSLTRRHGEITSHLRHLLMSELEILNRYESGKPAGMGLGEGGVAAPSLAPPAPKTKAAPPAPASVKTDADKRVPSMAEASESEGARSTDEQADEVEPTWTLRSIITGSDAGIGRHEEEDAEAAGAATAEKERIRRILEDLD